jgi:hypothetical protein
MLDDFPLASICWRVFPVATATHFIVWHLEMAFWVPNSCARTAICRSNFTIFASGIKPEHGLRPRGRTVVLIDGGMGEMGFAILETIDKIA